MSQELKNYIRWNGGNIVGVGSHVLFESEHLSMAAESFINSSQNSNNNYAKKISYMPFATIMHSFKLYFQSLCQHAQKSLTGPVQGQNRVFPV